MCEMISCLVGRDGQVYAVDGVHSHSTIAMKLGIWEDSCLKYEFHLKERKLFQDFDMDSAPFEAKASHDNAAMAFFNECAGTPEKLANFVRRGNWNEKVLTELLMPFAQKAYDETWTSTRKAYDETWASAQKALNEAYASAQKAYNEAIASAQKAYDEAIASAQKAYDETWASAQKALNEAIAPAQKALNEAYASAQKAFNEAIAPAQAFNEAIAPAQKAYNEANMNSWLELFFVPENRINIWK